MRATLPPPNLQPSSCNALYSLKKRDDILILPADKGRATVVLEKVGYDAKMLEMLSGDKTYKKLDHDPTPAIERRLNFMLLHLKDKGSISSDLYNWLLSSGGQTPKNHKPEVPLSDSFFSIFTYIPALEVFVQGLASSIRNMQSHAKKFTKFVSFIRTQIVGFEKVLVSFNIVALFTNIPVGLAV